MKIQVDDYVFLLLSRQMIVGKWRTDPTFPLAINMLLKSLLRLSNWIVKWISRLETVFFWVIRLLDCMRAPKGILSNKYTY